MNYQLFLQNEVLSFIQDEMKKSPIKETGGVLIGYKTNESIVVTNATGPGPQAKQTFFNFQRDVEYCNQQLDHFFHKSDGILTYIGEWHTHPFGKPIPSWQDDKEMFSIANTDIYQNDTPLLIIGRKNKEGLRIGSHLYFSKRRYKLSHILF